MTDATAEDPTAEKLIADPSANYFFGDDVEEMPESPRRVVTPWTLALMAIVIAAIGFVLGTQLEKRQDHGGGGGFALPDGFTPPAGAIGPNAAAGGGGGATIGEVKLVDGDVVYVTTADGTTVRVTTTSDSEVTTTSEGTVADLAVGDTVIVQGETGEDGTVAASSISEAGGLGRLTNPG